eukprot:CAMPEP_0119476822 /NCGR_PEP_ID=MMETSP1344-20130328/7197_1 /TAXON_ID=236787 /ORGANISM="Florenciella parvula, Strain CCMP2471" /LENGTH=330 /DNA_ID=CAMNT_0007510681 /DNA_START=54 /DNA_END=1046 /DNA_ORIENTATION=+
MTVVVNASSLDCVADGASEALDLGTFCRTPTRGGAPFRAEATPRYDGGESATRHERRWRMRDAAAPARPQGPPGRRRPRSAKWQVELFLRLESAAESACRLKTVQRATSSSGARRVFRVLTVHRFTRGPNPWFGARGGFPGPGALNHGSTPSDAAEVWNCDAGGGRLLDETPARLLRSRSAAAEVNVQARPLKPTPERREDEGGGGGGCGAGGGGGGAGGGEGGGHDIQRGPPHSSRQLQGGDLSQQQNDKHRHVRHRRRGRGRVQQGSRASWAGAELARAPERRGAGGGGGGGGGGCGGEGGSGGGEGGGHDIQRGPPHSSRQLQGGDL